MSCEAVKTGGKSVALEKAKAFAVRIVKMALHIRKTKKDFILSGTPLSLPIYYKSKTHQRFP